MAGNGLFRIQRRDAESDATSTRPPPLGVFAMLAFAVTLGVLSGSRPLIALAAGSVVLLGALLVTRPDWVTLTVIVLLYSNAAAIAVKVYGLPKAAGVLVLLILVVPFVYLVLVRREPILFPRTLPWLLGLLVVQLVGTVLARDFKVALDGLEDFVLSGFCLYLAVYNVVRTEQLLRRIAWGLVLVGALLGTLSLHQSLTGSYENGYLGFAQMREPEVDRQVDPVEPDAPLLRVAGPIGEQNRYAQIMVVLIPIALMRARHERRRALRLTALGCTVLIAAGAALTFSRGGAVGLLATLVIMCAFGHLRPLHLGLVVAGLALVLVAFPQWNERLSSIERSVPAVLSRDTSPFEADGATLGRIGANVAALYAFADHPIVGLGPGMFNTHYREYAIEAGYRVHDGTRATHNIYPEILAETGALGFVCIAAIVAMTLRELHQAARHSGRHRRRSWRTAMQASEAGSVAAGFLFALVAYLTTGFFLSLSYQRYFWLLLALGAASSAVVLGKPGFIHRDSAATAVAGASATP